MRKKIVVIVFLLIMILGSLSTIAMAYQNIKQNENTIKKSSYDLLVITHKSFKKYLTRLVIHKYRFGVKTKIKTTGEIYFESICKKYDAVGCDRQEKIKYFIKYAYDNWDIKYVLLVGDFIKIPVRYVYNNNNMENENWPEPCFISDLYYADIYDEKGEFSTWDTDNDKVYGEWIWNENEAQDKNINLSPNIYIGRLACRNTLEVRTMVNKIIRYESTYSNDSTWFKKIIVAAGDSYPKKPGYEGEEITLQILENMSRFKHVKLWTSDGSLKGPKDIIKEINNGSGFICLIGHTDPANWLTHPPNQTSWTDPFSNWHMPLLINGYKLPICVATGCHNGQFDVNIFNILKGVLNEGFYNYFKDGGDFWKYEWVPECWAWKLTSKKGGGAIATISDTGIGLSKEDKTSERGGVDYLNLLFFKEYHSNGTDILGEVWGKAINQYLKDFPINWSTPGEGDDSIDAKTVQQWVLFGDPSLKIGGYKKRMLSSPEN